MLKSWDEKDIVWPWGVLASTSEMTSWKAECNKLKEKKKKKTVEAQRKGWIIW